MLSVFLPLVLGDELGRSHLQGDSVAVYYSVIQPIDSTCVLSGYSSATRLLVLQ